MRDEPFFDTNILIYAYDVRVPRKRKICSELVSQVFSGEARGVISNQVLVEMHNALTMKLGVERSVARAIVGSFIASANWLKVNYSYITVKSALGTSNAFKSPFLDTLIAETMKENSISRIITENEKDFKKIPGILVTNPISD